MKLLAVFLCLVATIACRGMERSFQVTFRVVDDEGNPVEEANAGVSWENAKATKSSERIKGATGVTNQDGQVTLEGKTFTPGISYGVRKEGHYSAWGLRYHFNGTRLFRWQPWNPTIEVVLRRKKNPVPMYAKRVGVEIPASGVDVGYDLEVGDWVAPHGKGRVTDMIFHSMAEVKSDVHYRGELSVSFLGRCNGFIPFETALPQISPLRMPYESPATGYQPKRVWRSARPYVSPTNEKDEHANNSSKTTNYFIRVRSELDESGNVLRAWYGKIHAPFEYNPRGFDRNGATGRQSIHFVYYLNPDGTRNIEFDPNRNLLTPADRDDISFRGLEP